MKKVIIIGVSSVVVLALVTIALLTILVLEFNQHRSDIKAEYRELEGRIASMEMTIEELDSLMDANDRIDDAFSMLKEQKSWTTVKLNDLQFFLERKMDELRRR